MTTPTSNLNLSAIQTEFGGSNPISMSEYYAGGGRVSNPPPTSGSQTAPIPTGGEIRMGAFLGVSAAPVFGFQALPNRTWNKSISGPNNTGAFTWVSTNSGGVVTCFRGGSVGENNVHVYDDPWATNAPTGGPAWVRATLVSGQAPNGGSDSSLNTWINLSIFAVGWSCQARTNGTNDVLRQMVIRLDFAATDGGTIMTSATYTMTSNASGIQ